MSAVLDTHTVLWYLEDSEQLSTAARNTIEDAVRAARQVSVSVISIIETVYLVERKKLPAAALQRLQHALTDTGAVLAIAPIDLAVANALEHIPRNVVPDMPDRIIAATAVHLGAPLVTRDRRLRAAGIQTIW